MSSNILKRINFPKISFFEYIIYYFSWFLTIGGQVPPIHCNRRFTRILTIFLMLVGLYSQFRGSWIYPWCRAINQGVENIVFERFRADPWCVVKIKTRSVAWGYVASRRDEVGRAKSDRKPGNPAPGGLWEPQVPNRLPKCQNGGYHATKN